MTRPGPCLMVQFNSADALTVHEALQGRFNPPEGNVSKGFPEANQEKTSRGGESINQTMCASAQTVTAQLA